ncbi:MAG: N-formylglutamate amidohydrolase, partial [Magnetococcales bacterium]|nr:N-formylglutamate amidohydrolase [Magnetococcales bacterium]
MSPELFNLSALTDLERLREEDPYTGTWTKIAPTSVVVHRSRFEVDMNRPRDLAVYQTPQDAWGLNLWQEPISPEMKNRSLTLYDDFYSQMELIFNQAQARWGKFVVLDLHSYNGRRGGPKAPLDSPELNPEINIGTRTMNRELWNGILDNFINNLAE